MTAPPDQIYQIQDRARMTVRGGVVRHLPEDTVIIRATSEDGDVHEDGSPIVVRGARPVVPPDSWWLVIWIKGQTPVVHPTAEFTVAEALRACQAWTAVPRASCVAHTLAREVARLRAELSEEKGFTLHLNESLDAGEEEEGRLAAVVAAQHAELIKLRRRLIDEGLTFEGDTNG